MTELLEKYGRVRVARMIQAFYHRVLDSPRLSRYFSDVDLKGLVLHQTTFMRTVLGDEMSYTRNQIREVHQRLRISPEDFEEMLWLLHEELIDHGFSEEDAETVIGIYRGYRPEVSASGTGGAIR